MPRFDRFPQRITENTTYGDKLLKILQDDSSPTLDLLVRESIQNSLDACLNPEMQVKVDFTIKSFDLEIIEELFEFNARESRFSNKFLEIRDRNTIGLTGPVSLRNMEDPQELGNYLKLVMSIGVNQTRIGAGGSWGLGKTIYYRLGKGLVFFYSRISATEQRLIACWVEDQSKLEGNILREFGIKTGVCWWGNVRRKKLSPITDGRTINAVLDRFGLQAFDENEAGTSIIIPFIDKTLHAEPIKESIRKWYTPRISLTWDLRNEAIPRIPRLEVRVNRSLVDPSEEPLFKIINLLNSYGLSNDKGLIQDNSLPSEEHWHREEIKYSNSRIILGFLTWVELTADHLKLSNKRSPDEVLGFVSDDEGTVKLGHRDGGGFPLLVLVRKPGMIIQYLTDDSKWGLNFRVKEGQWIFAAFTINSSDLNVEEYFRACENANHMKWEHNQTTGMPDYLKSAQKQIRDIFKEKLKEQEQIKIRETSFQLSRQMAEIFMPSNGFGNRANGSSNTDSRAENEEIRKRRRNTSFELIDPKVHFKGNIISFQAKLELSKISQALILLRLENRNSSVDYLSWKSDFPKLPFPFKIVEYSISDLETRHGQLAENGIRLIELDESRSYKLVINIELKIVIPGFQFSLQVIKER